MFRCRLVCAYVEVNIVYHCFTQVRHVLTGFMYVFGLVWLFVLFFHSLYVCVSSDPQSSRARKLCVTMEPALLLKGDIMVRNNLITVWHLLRFFFISTCSTSLQWLKYHNCFYFLSSVVKLFDSHLVNFFFSPDFDALLCLAFKKCWIIFKPLKP